MPRTKARYTKERYQATLRVFRRAKAADRRSALNFPAVEWSLRNKYDFRNHGPLLAVTQAPRWQQDDSDDDDEYEPNGKIKKRKSVEKSSRPKRKADDVGDGDKDKKKAKIGGSSLQQLRSKVAFITLKLESDQCKDVLKSLAEKHGTGMQSRPPFRSTGPLSTASMDIWEWEKEARKRYETYEEKQKAEAEEIDNVGGRALRNRKVPDIEAGTKKKRNKLCDEADPISPEASQDDIHQESKSGTRRLNGLLTPTSASPPQATEQLAQPRSQSNTNRANNPIIISPSPSPEYRLKQIRTRWAHPIDFRYLVGPGKRPCNFCSSFLYGIYGLKDLSVEVITQSSDNEKYVECGGGNREMGEDATKMCISCALDRLYVSNCHNHKLKALPGLDKHNPKIGSDKMRTFVRQIMQSETAGKKLVYPVCSLCPCPALWRCCTRQKLTKTGGNSSFGREPEGCGLLVCQDCKDMLQCNEGVLDRGLLRAHLRERRASGITRHLRADTEFLFAGSLLHQAYSPQQCPANRRSQVTGTQ